MRATDRIITTVQRLVREDDTAGLKLFLEGIMEGVRGTEQPSLIGEAAERKATITYLRREAELPNLSLPAAAHCVLMANAIEAGDHHKNPA